MLSILSQQRARSCDGHSRRHFLKIGGLALGGMSLPDILCAESTKSAADRLRSHKAVIMIFLAGGPPHLDMFDLKPDAPLEIRGEFSPIKTNVAGIEICELMPRMAAIMDKLAIIRSVVETPHDHAAFHCLTGRPRTTLSSPTPQPAGGWPALGAVASKVQGPVYPSMPPFVGLAPEMKLKEWADPGSPGYLGMAHAPFQPRDNSVRDMMLHGMPITRFDNRRMLLAGLDRMRREMDQSGLFRGMDAHQTAAFDILTSPKLAQALDLSLEDPRTVAAYGQGGPPLHPTSMDQPDATGDLRHFLMARRLVEAGARCVTLNFGKYDWHDNNFREARHTLPLLDRGVATLVEDLHQRGLDRDVSVIVWGEFGRSPKINANGGRDHWNQVMSAVLAGGGMRVGQVIGATDRYAESAKERPVHFQEVFATLYDRLGIDVAQTVFKDLSGRPQALLDVKEPIRELL